MLKHIHLFEVYNAGRAATAALLAFFSFFFDTVAAALPRQEATNSMGVQSGIIVDTKPLQSIEVMMRP